MRPVKTGNKALTELCKTGGYVMNLKESVRYLALPVFPLVIGIPVLMWQLTSPDVLSETKRGSYHGFVKYLVDSWRGVDGMCFDVLAATIFIFPYLCFIMSICLIARRRKEVRTAHSGVHEESLLANSGHTWPPSPTLPKDEDRRQT